MVLFGHGEMLYTQVATTMASEAEKLAASLLADHAAQTDDGAFLPELLGKWKTPSTAVAMINDVVRYMDAVFVPKRGKVPVRELGHRAWRKAVVGSDESTPVGATLRAALLEISRRERAGGAPVDAEICGLMAAAAKMLVDLGGGAYEETLEAPFLDEAARFYAVESVRLRLELGSCSSCGEYLGEVESMADAERARAARCGLDAAQMGEKAAAVVLREMVEKDGVAMARLVGGLAAMLAEGRCSDMARMHRLLGRVPGGVAAIRSAMEAHFREIRERAGDDERMLSGEKDRYREMIDGVFHGEVSFHAALDSCFG